MNIAEKLTQIAENEQKVYDSGYNNGVADGKQAEYDAFWDAKQPYKNTPVSMTGEYGGSWSAETFKPKYNLTPTYSQYMFYVNNLKIDLVEHLKNIGIKLDFSQCKNMGATFMGAAFTHIGSVCGNGVGVGGVFQSCKNLVTIDEFGNYEGGDITPGTDTTFQGCTALENITIKGKFTGDVYFHWSTKLTRKSIESIIAALSENVSGKTLQLSQTAVSTAFPDDWDSYVRTHKPSGWTITLV